MPMHEEMIVTGAWWDFVDTIASHQVGFILRAEGRRMKPLPAALQSGLQSDRDGIWETESFHARGAPA